MDLSVAGTLPNPVNAEVTLVKLDYFQEFGDGRKAPLRESRGVLG